MAARSALLPMMLALLVLALPAGCRASSSEGPREPVEAVLQRLPLAGLLDQGRLDVGPVPRPLPPGALVPRDERQLAEWLADPAG
ncbi:MAG: hypothetical protein ABR538_08930, partial [Candidatus Binatia bacterium]